MQILTRHATIGLQTKFEINRTKNDILGIWAHPRDPIGTPLGSMDIQNCQIYVDVDSYSSCYNRPKN